MAKPCRRSGCQEPRDRMSCYCSASCERNDPDRMTNEDWNDLRRGVASGDVPNPLAPRGGD